SPHFVALNIGHRQAAHCGFQEALALFSDENKQGKDCGVMQAGQPFYRADRASFTEKLKAFLSFVERGVHLAKRRGVIFGKALAARSAAKTLKSVAVLPKL